MTARAWTASVLGMFLLTMCWGIARAAQVPQRDAAGDPLASQAPRIVGRYEKLELTVPFETFPDVPWHHWAFGETEACLQADIVYGLPDGTFGSDSPVDRARMAVFVARALAGGDANVPEAPLEPTFPDVPASHWAYKYIEHLTASGVTAGYPEGPYDPGATVNRGQMAVYIARAIATPPGEAGLADYVPPETPTFADVTPEGDWGWCYRYVEYIVDEGIARGYPEDGLYHPEVVCTADQVAVYVARAFDLDIVRTDPFDPADISVTAVFHSPAGRTITIPGFYYQAYHRSRDEHDDEVLRPAGRGVFKIRFAPDEETGTYTYDVTVADRWGERVAESGAFEVAALPHPESRGYVRRSEASQRYFEFDSGDPYFAIGENLAWPSGNGEGTHYYDVWMGKLYANGANCIRLLAIDVRNTLYLEHLPLEPRDGNGLGRYDQKAAWRIDYILDLADLLGIKVLLCVEGFHNFVPLRQWEWGRWDTNPYNADNGGPCVDQTDFLTDPEAREFFKRRLRYIAARWGYSTAVLAWELLCEVDGFPGYDSDLVSAWHQEMAGCLRDTDAWDHLVTTSFGLFGSDPLVDGLPELDFVQSHTYGSEDFAATMWDVCQTMSDTYSKPHLVTEFGFDEQSMLLGRDPDGVHLHNGLWSSMLSGAAGTAMQWWYPNYVEPNDLYYHFAPVAAYASDVHWVQEDYEPAEVLEVRWAGAQGPMRSEALRSEAFGARDFGADQQAPPNLRALALSNLTSALLWVQNKDYTWWDIENGLDPEPIGSCEVELGGFISGAYEIQQWDTYTGALTWAYLYSSTDGSVVVTTPPGLAADAAYKIRKLR